MSTMTAIEMAGVVRRPRLDFYLKFASELPADYILSPTRTVDIGPTRRSRYSREIRYSERFINYFGQSMLRVIVSNRTNLIFRDLLVDVPETILLNALGQKTQMQTSWDETAFLLEEQCVGRTEALSETGARNLFFTAKAVVDVHWLGKVWEVDAIPYDIPGPWMAGSRIFTPVAEQIVS